MPIQNSKPIDIVVRADSQNEAYAGLVGSNEILGTVKNNFTKPGTYNTPSMPQMIMRSVAVNQIASASRNALQSEFNYRIARYGDTTGNYIRQQSIQNTLSNVSAMANVGMAAVHGAMAGGPIGAVIGLTVAGIGIGINTYQNYRNYNFDNAKQNINAQFSSSMIGGLLTNGNRG